MTIYITSDLHFGHDKIIGLCGRPTTIEDHHEWLIRQINKTVRTSDTVYHLGDFSFCNDVSKINAFCNRLNGNWFHILGNHDRESKLAESFINTRHKILGHYHELKYKGQFIMLMHYPIESWNRKHYGSYHLFGHLHTREIAEKALKPLPNRMLMSLDSHPEFIPYKLDDVLEEMQLKKETT